MPDVVISSLTFAYSKKTVFNGFSATFNGPGVYLLTGPSGCGKTTLLRLIAELEKAAPDAVKVSDPVAYAFQEYRLFPTVSALRNVTCVRNPKTKEEAERNDAEALSLLLSLGLSETDANALPDELSGGMKQRVSLARALFSPHPIKLLDEVTKELDPASIGRVLEQIAIAAKNSLILFSTHHPEDCEKLGAARVELPPLN